MTSPVIWIIHLMICAHSDRAYSLCTDQGNVTFNQSTIEHAGKCYTVNFKRLSWYGAKHHCENHGGELAMINKILLGNGSDFRRVFGEICPYGCSWLGLSDEQTEGDWIWTDGSPVTSVKWQFDTPGLRKYRFPIWDCGRLYRFLDGQEFLWDMMACDVPSYFVCQYDSKIPRRSRPKKSETKKIKVSRIARSRFLIKDEPLFVKKTYATTMCFRFCRDPCRVFSYNAQTGHCRGFGGMLGKLEGVKSSKWDTWEVTMI